MNDVIFIFTTRYIFKDTPGHLFFNAHCDNLPISTPGFTKQLLIHYPIGNIVDKTSEPTYKALITRAFNKDYSNMANQLLITSNETRFKDLFKLIKDEGSLVDIDSFNAILSIKLSHYKDLKYLAKRKDAPVYAYRSLEAGYTGKKSDFLKLLIEEVLHHHRVATNGSFPGKIYLIAHDKDWEGANQKTDLEITDQEQVAELGLNESGISVRVFVFTHEPGAINDMLVNFQAQGNAASEFISQVLNELMFKREIKKIKEEFLRNVFIYNNSVKPTGIMDEKKNAFAEKVKETHYVLKKRLMVNDFVAINNNRKMLVDNFLSDKMDISQLTYESLQSFFDDLLTK